MTIAQGDVEASAWPYTSTGFATTGQDPVNIVFIGTADPRQIRATLLGLAGSGRPGPLAGFTCTWSDAVGNPQTSYAQGEGSVAAPFSFSSAVSLVLVFICDCSGKGT